MQFQVRVARVRDEATNIRGFELVSLSGDALPAFTAGSHIEVTTPNGAVRPYSLCSDPGDHDRYMIAVQREPASRGGSSSLHDQVTAGDLLTVTAPKNLFPLNEDAQMSVLLAGGIGITPILAMSQRLLALDASFALHYCAKSPERAAFADLLAQQEYASHVHFHYSAAQGSASGRCDLITAIGAPERGKHLYVCGPRAFMEAALTSARNSGWPEASLHYEFFSNDLQQHVGDREYRIRLRSSDLEVLVAPGQSATAALEAAGVYVPVSCGEGICGTCVTKVLQGTPDHRDLFFSAAEQAANDQFTPCCSRSKTPVLVLDL